MQNLDSDFSFNSGFYQGQINEKNQKHGYGKWVSSDSKLEFAFGDWLFDNLVDGTENRLEEDEIKIHTYNQTKLLLESKHQNIV